MRNVTTSMREARYVRSRVARELCTSGPSMFLVAWLGACASDPAAMTGTQTASPGAAGTHGGVAGSAAAVAGGSAAGSGAAGAGIAGGSAGAAGGAAATAGASGSAAGALESAAGSTGTFTQVLKIFDDHFCGTCHAMAAANNANGNLMFNASSGDKSTLYKTFVGGMSKSALCSGKTYVTKGSPEQSLLYDKLAEAKPECGQRMPLGDQLTAGELATLRSWIIAGAPND